MTTSPRVITAKGHFRSQCPKLATVGPSKTPQKPVALLVWPDWVGRRDCSLLMLMKERNLLMGRCWIVRKGLRRFHLFPPLLLLL